MNVCAHSINKVYSEHELLMYWKKATEHDKSVLLLGGGCNVLFLENFNGIVLLNRIKGVLVNEDDSAWYLHVGAGEIWHRLVVYSLSKNMPGLENLALIPGYVGAAPIQNIGAFGVELQQFCEYVDVLQFYNENRIRLNATECQFGYRDSIFKNKLDNQQYAIVAVGLKINKNWYPILRYKSLRSLNVSGITPYQIFNFICKLRQKILPDPAIIGNAGSFFKNPIIDENMFNTLLRYNPDMPYYLQRNGSVKLFAGWLIDRCHLKGYRLGNAAVYNKQALILINCNQRATGMEIIKLASYVRNKVADRFSIWLEPEVRFIAAQGEVDALQLLQ